MTFSVGRASFTNAPRAVSHDGDVVSFNIDILPSSLAEAKVLRQQVLGLVDNDDEPVVPVTWSDDSDYDGFYAVLEAACEPAAAYLTNKLIRCTIALQRVTGGYAFPQTELLSSNIARTNFDAATPLAISVGINAGVGATRTTTTGTVDVGSSDSAGAAFTAKRYYVTPADHYIGAATIEYQMVNGGSWSTVLGRQTPAPYAWRITNGFVRFTPGTNGVIEVWNGSAWEAGANLRWGNSGLTAKSDFSVVSPIIVKNSPERVVVRSVDPTVKIDATFTLERGATLVQIYTFNIGVAFASTTASTLIGTHVLHQTSNDANGNRVVLGGIGTTGGAHSTSTTNGAVYVSGAASLMVGVNFNGSGAAGVNTASYVQQQWMGISGLTQRIVTR